MHATDILGFRKKVKDKLSKLGAKLGERRTSVDSEEYRHRALSLSLQSESSIVGGGQGRRRHKNLSRKKRPTSRYPLRQQFCRRRSAVVDARLLRLHRKAVSFPEGIAGVLCVQLRTHWAFNHCLDGW